MYYWFGYYLTRNAVMCADQLAFSCYGKEYTWKELNQEVNRIANSMSGLGICKGERLAYLFRNSTEAVLTFLATQKIGAVALPVNPSFLPGEISRIFEITECKTVVYDKEFESLVQEVCAVYPQISVKITTDEDHPDAIPFSELYKGSDREAQIKLSENDESMIILTSGTTGVSKIVVRTQKMMREYGQMLAIENDNVHVREVALTHCPFFHTACLSILVKMLALHGTFVLVNRVDPEYIFEQIQHYQVTQMLVVPPLIYMRLYDSGLWHDYNLDSLRQAQFTGGKCNMDYVNKICEMFPNAKLRASYGSTETCAPCSMVISREEILTHPERLTSVGHINTGVELKIVDQNMNEVKPGVVGEAIVRSPMVFKGYLNNDELNRKVIQDGWFHTEDLMRVDEYGYYYLVDRMKDMIKTGGENVYAQEVEDVLRNHPAIRDCAIIGVPDARFEEAVAAAIVLNDKAKGIADEELIDYCKQHLPSFKKPRYVAYLDEIPHNITGKVQKSVLREHPEQFRPIV